MTASEKKIADIIHSVGLKNNLRDIEVLDIINSQYKFIHEVIINTPFEGLSDEEIDNIKTSFILKYIGKIYTDKDIIRRIHNRKSFVKKLREENESKECK